MIIFDAISIKALGRDTKEDGTGISEFIVEKDTASKKYNITWFEHNIIGKNNSEDYRDSKVETHISIPEFTKDLEKLIEKYFGTHIKSFENIITGK